MILTGTENKFFYKGGRTYVKNPQFSDAAKSYQPITPEDKSVIIVGNSPTILNCELGHIIDSNFDIVVRLNEFQTEGYEAFTGERTDIWFTGASRSAIPRNEQDYKYEIVVGLPFRRSRMLRTIDGCYLVDEALKKSIGIPLSDVKFIPHAAITEIKIDMDFKNPSTGFICIYSFVQFFSFKSVTIYGFDFFQKQWHYYDKDEIPVNKISLAHEWDRERATIEEWGCLGKLNILGNV